MENISLSYIKDYQKAEWISFIQDNVGTRSYDDLLLGLINTLYEKTDFFTAPASTKYHSAYPGGLSKHSIYVAQCLLKLTKAGICRSWERPVSPVLIGLLHDATKWFNYEPDFVYANDKGVRVEYSYNKDRRVLSEDHGKDSALKALKFIDLSEEEIACITYHMGAYETDHWVKYDAAIKKYPNVLWTHTADMYASKVLEVL